MRALDGTTNTAHASRAQALADVIGGASLSVLDAFSEWVAALADPLVRAQSGLSIVLTRVTAWDRFLCHQLNRAPFG
jgi:hypothetical protein